MKALVLNLHSLAGSINISHIYVFIVIQRAVTTTASVNLGGPPPRNRMHVAYDTKWGGVKGRSCPQ